MPTVLLIDDNPLIVDFVRLAVPSWQIISALTGRKGLALLREHQDTIDVVVLDVGLPGIDGRLVCARIRAIAPSIPIVPFTGNALADDELREMGCEPAVLKPASPEALAQALRVALGHATLPPPATPLLEFVQEYAAQLEQAENRGSALADLPAECQPVPRAHLDDLDMNLVRRHIARTVEHRGYTGPVEPLDYLRRHFCVLETDAGLVPTLIGVLVFAPDAERWVSATGIDIAEFQGPAAPQHLVYTQQVRGPLIEVIDQAVNWLWARIDHRYDLVGIERTEKHAYARRVLRELTVNALCHRDWSYRGSTVRVQLFPTCIEWVTPGGLPTGVTTTNLRTAQVSRNPALMHLLYHAGLVEKLGIGIDTVLDTLQAQGCDPPALYDDGSFFTFRVWGKPLAAPAADMATPVVLTQRQERILAEIHRRGSCTTTELAELLGETARTIQRDLKDLAESGAVVGVGQTHNRRYQLRRPDQS